MTTPHTATAIAARQRRGGYPWSKLCRPDPVPWTGLVKLLLKPREEQPWWSGSTIDNLGGGKGGKSFVLALGQGAAAVGSLIERGQT